MSSTLGLTSIPQSNTSSPSKTSHAIECESFFRRAGAALVSYAISSMPPTLAKEEATRVANYWDQRRKDTSLISSEDSQAYLNGFRANGTPTTRGLLGSCISTVVAQLHDFEKHDDKARALSCGNLLTKIADAYQNIAASKLSAPKQPYSGAAFQG